MSAFDQLLSFVKVISSQVTGPNAATSINASGFAGLLITADGTVISEDTSDEAGELAHEQELFGTLGFFGRPLPPAGELFAEALVARTGDGLVPIAFRDLRINRAINPGGAPLTPAEGQLGIGGYGGGFLSFSLTAAPVGSARANIAVLYVPHDFDADGIPQKAHVIAVDPTPGNSSIQLIHASGVVLTLTEDAGNGEPGIVWAADAGSFGRITPSDFVVQCPKIMLKGNVYVGAQAELGAPLLAGPTSPPCPSLFVSPV